MTTTTRNTEGTDCEGTGCDTTSGREQQTPLKLGPRAGTGQTADPPLPRR